MVRTLKRLGPHQEYEMVSSCCSLCPYTVVGTEAAVTIAERAHEARCKAQEDSKHFRTAA